MGQTKEGAQKAKQKRIEALGGQEAYSAHMAKIARDQRGAKKPKSGFGTHKDRASEMARKGNSVRWGKGETTNL